VKQPSSSYHSPHVKKDLNDSITQNRFLFHSANQKSAQMKTPAVSKKKQRAFSAKDLRRRKYV